MARKSCYHCGIEDTRLWRTGPSEKPVLCNACGTRWRLKGTLAGYIPKHGLTMVETTAAKPDVESFPFSFKVPRRKRSVLPQYCLTPTGRLHRQLLHIQNEQQSAGKTSDEERNELLIYNNNWMTSFD